ncbi:MAG: hypothetical protein IKK76_01420 [Alphaproteobacteria bacterium]|nr:hypothetical protein [Alphaproteobacteria bacterium]
MKPEQLNWTDKDWAAHLGCVVQDVPKFKHYLEQNFWLGIWQERDTKLKYAEIQVRHDTPSGNVRYVPMATSRGFNMSLDAMVRYTNNEFIPSLELKPAVAGLRGVPPKILQMLHIEQNKKER